MKNLKKLLSVMMAFVMVLGFTMLTAQADDPKITITITNPQEGKDYYAYKLFDAVANADGSAVAYTANTSQRNFFETDTIQSELFTFTEIATETDKYTVVLKDGITAEDIANYVNENLDSLIETQKISFTKNGSENPKATVSPGYYFINTTTGSAIELTTATGSSVKVNDKSDINFDKAAKLATGRLSEANATVTDYKVGDEVEFTISFNAYKGWSGVNVTDILDKGLTLKDTQTITVTAYLLGGEQTITPNPLSGHYTANKETITVEGEDKGKEKLTVNFVTPITDKTPASYIFDRDMTVKIVYKATVTSEATFVDGPVANNATLKGDHDWITGNDNVKFKFYQFSIKKIDGETNNALAGAKFTLKDNGNKVVNLSKKTNADGEIEYYYPDANGDAEVETPENGVIVIKGLSGATYTLTETQAPAGYNKLSQAISVNPKADDNTTSIKPVLMDSESDLTEFIINNNKGVELPETGGMGTIMFYIAGGVLLIGAVVLIITNKRMQRN